MYVVQEVTSAGLQEDKNAHHVAVHVRSPMKLQVQDYLNYIPQEKHQHPKPRRTPAALFPQNRTVCLFVCLKLLPRASSSPKRLPRGFEPRPRTSVCTRVHLYITTCMLEYRERHVHTKLKCMEFTSVNLGFPPKCYELEGKSL